MACGVVLVVPADPELPGFALVAALGCVVEDGVVAHDELEPAPGGRVRVIERAFVCTNELNPGLSVR